MLLAGSLIGNVTLTPVRWIVWLFCLKKFPFPFATITVTVIQSECNMTREYSRILLGLSLCHQHQTTANRNEEQLENLPSTIPFYTERVEKFESLRF